MNGKEAEANESSETTDQHEHNQQNLAAPPSYDEIIHTQSLIHNNGGDRKLEHVEHQPIRLQLSPDSYHNYPSTGVFTIRPAVGLYPEHLICPFCQDEISTRVEYVTTAKTHINAMLCCAICWPFGWCPYLLKECHDAHHYCPKCRAIIGIHSP